MNSLIASRVEVPTTGSPPIPIAVEIPYYDVEGYEVQTKIRTSLNKSEQRFAWKGHSDPILYGLQLITQMEGNTLIFVEGEFDVQVATFHGLNTVGVSGNTGFNPDMLDPILDRFNSFYVLMEKLIGLTLENILKY